MDKADIEKIARLVQKAFTDIQENLLNNTLSKEQEAAIASLPLDMITKSARNRLKKFPDDCCIDAAYVLAVIFIAISQQNGFQYGQLKQIRCHPTDKTMKKMFDKHQWLLIDGYNVDITFEQCKTVLKGNEGEIIFDTHPLVGSDDYSFASAKAVIEEPYAEFANFVIINYFRG